MTPEERANQIHLDLICRDDFLMEDFEAVRRDIALAIRHAKAEAYGESMRAVCGYCKEGLPIVHLYGDGPSGAGEWILHKRDGEPYPCTAEPIHRLVDSLVSSVSS